MRAELLAPAGSYESLVAAVNAGADAVYIGGMRFGARAYAKNPDQEMLLQAIRYCHLHGSRIYLTVNTLFKERELEEELVPFLQPLYENGLDAVIVQDLGALSLIREQFPDMELHASTQMTLGGAPGCRFLEEQGVTRVVLSRELSLGEIREIHEQIHTEIEAFVHGALCFCYSGQCLFSSMLGGRSGNRGRCAQPCRLPYELTDGKHLLNRENENCLLSPKDICTLDILPDILEAGVYSLKIEGRMKRPEYTAGVVRIYRKYLDLFLKYGRAGYTVSEKDKKELMDLYNRGGFSRGYYEMRNGREMMSPSRPNHNGTEAARVMEVRKGSILLKALEDLYEGDALDAEALSGGKQKELTVSADVKKGSSFTVRMPVGNRLQKGQVLQRMRCEKLLNELKEAYIDTQKKEKINGNLRILRGQPAILAINMGCCRVTVTGEAAGDAKNQPLSAEKVKKQIEKTGSTPFVFEHLDIELEENSFLPLQSLNELRRRGLEALEEAVLSGERRQMTAPAQVELSCERSCDRILRVSLEQRDAFLPLAAMKGIDGIYLDSAFFTGPLTKDMVMPWIRACHENEKECFYIMPWILRSRMQREFEQKEVLEALRQFDGILLKNIESYMLLRSHSPFGRLMLDHNMYTYNRRSRKYWQDAGISMDTAPLELNARELYQRGGEGSELIVYGYLPLMVSAQCLNKTADRCRKQEKVLYLKDRKGKYFPVRNYCRPCYNVIYNSTPMTLLDQREEIERIAPSSLRLSFTTEPVSQILEIAERHVAGFVQGVQTDPGFSEFTRGHFKRGIE